jgi:hypothetical protein
LVVIAFALSALLHWQIPNVSAAPVGIPDTPLATADDLRPAKVDWLVGAVEQPAAVYRAADGGELVMTNGLIRRTWRLAPNAATVSFDNLMTGASLLRAVEPEAVVEVNGKRLDVGGLVGKGDRAYLTRQWVDSLRTDPAALRLIGWEAGKTKERFPWKRVRHHDATLPWPPPGVSLRLDFEVPTPAAGSPSSGHAGLRVSVHYEMYDGIPLLAKWLVVHNGGTDAVRLNKFTSEVLAVVEAESVVDRRESWRLPDLHVESDYAFRGMDPATADRTTNWVADPRYETQVNFERKTPCLLESRPPIGPEASVEPGGAFETFRTYELAMEGSDRERNGLAVRRMYRTLAPWVTENPLMMHLTDSKPAAVRAAVDQCASVGFEMVILSFGSGLNMESADPGYATRYRELADYARGKGVELGGYSLLASRRVSDEDDCINPKTGKPGGMTFGDSPCLGSRWGESYFRNVDRFLRESGFSLLEHDGSYPGDVCASTAHPGHRGLEDSQWTQWKRITEFYRRCRGDGVYLNVPDWYVLQGSNKVAMGYRESNWSLPRDQQLVHARQNMYDGTWQKSPSMGWMFVPLVQYHGGGAAATIEPLSQHLDAYEAHLANCLGYGVQACYRGPRLYDADGTEALVRKWVAFFKGHRPILESDVIHLRRADGRGWDGVLHINPRLEECGLAVIYNPSDQQLDAEVELPLYYAGLTDRATVAQEGREPHVFSLDRAYKARVPVRIGPRSMSWLSVRRPR